MPDVISNRLELALMHRAENNNLRQLKLPSGLVDFCSNDYLGLAQSEELHQQIVASEGDFTRWKNGSTGSRLISGNTSLNEMLEDQLANIFKSEATLVFNSGYTANLALLSTIPKKGDVILYDELSHASIKDGIRLSFADKFSFKHNDLFDLERLLQKKISGQVFVVVESIYSMDGDEFPMENLVDIVERHGAILIVDEAHSTGVTGEKGGGLCIEIHQQIFARIFTFGKGMGVHGACIAGSSLLINYLVNFARPFIYSTAMSLNSLISIQGSFKYLADNMHLQQQLMNKVDLFVKRMKQEIPDRYLSRLNKGAIQAILIPGNDNAKKVSGHLMESGYDVRPILSPTVRQGEERVRICLHIFNSNEEILGLVTALKQVLS